MSTIPPPIQGCIEACERCELVLDAVTSDLYAVGRNGHRSIGAHLRHALEHVLCFVDGLPKGLIDYDSRDRDEALERDPEILRQKLREVSAALLEIPEQGLTHSVSVRQAASLDTGPATLQSTVERELVFISSHMIHHLAVIVAYCREEDVQLPEETALAFSTSAFLKAAAQ